MFNVTYTPKPIEENNDSVDVYANIVSPDIDGPLNAKVFEESGKIKYTYMTSVTHLKFEECKALCDKLLKTYNDNDIAALFKNIVTIDQQLYVDIISFINAIITEADSSKLRVYLNTLISILGLEVPKEELDKNHTPKEVPPPRFEKEPNLKNLPKKKEKETATEEKTEAKN